MKKWKSIYLIVHILMLVIIFVASTMLVLRYFFEALEDRYLFYGLAGLTYGIIRLAIDLYLERKESQYSVFG